MSTSWKVLSVGNSFSVDTMEHLVGIAEDRGIDTMVLGNLYIGGCSIRKHYALAAEDAASYEYFVNRGDGWQHSVEHSSREVLRSEQWDAVSIQHGSADGSLYGDAAYYEMLPRLVEYIKTYAPQAMVAFNMTWPGEPHLTWSEITRYDGDQQALYRAIAAVTRDTVLTTPGIDVISPTGTAIQNARAVLPFPLTRDGYHLSLDVGRYIAGLTFFKALSGRDIGSVSWCPEGVTDEVRALSVKAAEAAVAVPFEVTAINL